MSAPGVRGLFWGNRGCLHNDRGEVVRNHAVKRWITCVLVYKDWRHPLAAPGRLTALFFLDEPTALAAGHRPCALCRRADYEAYRDAWAGSPRADDMDEVLHQQRLAGPHRASWASLPDGVIVELGGAHHLVWRGRLHLWTDGGYDPASQPRPTSGTVLVCTPAATVSVLTRGYEPKVHPSAPGGKAPPSRPNIR